MKIKRIDSLYLALTGKTERAEIEEILSRATIFALRLYLRCEGGYEACNGTSRWKKADYVRVTADLILGNIAMKEEQVKILADIAKQETAEQEETTEDEATMTVAINQAVKTIKTAETTEAIREILLNCGKVKDMAETFEAVTGEAYGERMIAVRKTEIASDMASRIIRVRENEAFKALSLSEKYEALKACTKSDEYEVYRYAYLCTMSELRTMARELGAKEEEYANLSECDKSTLERLVAKKIEMVCLKERLTGGASLNDVFALMCGMSYDTLFELAFSTGLVTKGEDKSGYALANMLIDHYKTEQAKGIFEAVKNAKSLEQAREILKCDTSILEKVSEMAGSDFHERISEARAALEEANMGKVNSEQLIDWAVSWIIERLGLNFASETVAEAKKNIMTAKNSVEVMKILDGYSTAVLKAILHDVGTDFEKEYMQDGLERLPEKSVRFWLELGITECLEGEKIFEAEKLSA